MTFVATSINLPKKKNRFVVPIIAVAFVLIAGIGASLVYKKITASADPAKADEAQIPLIASILYNYETAQRQHLRTYGENPATLDKLALGSLPGSARFSCAETAPGSFEVRFIASVGPFPAGSVVGMKIDASGNCSRYSTGVDKHLADSCLNGFLSQ